jgi:hypothetical protein
MYTSKSGKKFGSIFAGRKHDADHTEDGMHSEGGPKESPEHDASETPSFEAGEQEGAKEHEGVQMNEGKEHNGEVNERGDDQEDEQHETHPVVAEHGPAHKVVIHHDEATGRHTVTSHHKDGHVHTNVHEHAHNAHEEARELANVPPAGKEENVEKDGFNHKDQGQQGAPSEEDGFAMPNLV